MAVQVEKKEKNMAVITVTVPAEDFRKAMPLIERAYNEA